MHVTENSKILKAAINNAIKFLKNRISRPLKKRIPQNTIVRAKIKSQSLTQAIEIKQCPTLKRKIKNKNWKIATKIFEHSFREFKIHWKIPNSSNLLERILSKVIKTNYYFDKSIHKITESNFTSILRNFFLL